MGTRQLALPTHQMNEAIREARREMATKEDWEIAHMLVMLAEAGRYLDPIKRKALLYVAADRITKSVTGSES